MRHGRPRFSPRLFWAMGARGGDVRALRAFLLRKRTRKASHPAPAYRRQRGLRLRADRSRASIQMIIRGKQIN